MLELQAITKDYRSVTECVHALRGVSLRFRDNEFVSILGPSGCGKTTLLNIIGGLDRYTAGDLLINGVSTKQYRDRDWDAYRNHTIGFVFQSYNLIPHQSVLANVELALTLSGVSRKERRARAIAVLEKVGLGDQLHKRPNQMSGCGKTTLLNIIGGLDRYTAGDLLINGVSTKQYRDRDWDAYRNHTIGFVFQSYNLIPHQSVLANVELALTLSGVSRKERRARAIAVLEKVGLGDQLHKRPNQMSGGQMQRVAIARALINDPDILLADEPTGALDSETSVQIMEILKEVARDRLVIMVTHNPELAERYSTRIIRLLDGSVVDDTQPCTADEPQAPRPARTGRTSMSFLTALSLSLHNLMTKKARTILIAFAGSIGIIGIALILSLSSGVQSLIDRMERETLSSYPLTIQKNTVDFSSMMNMQADVEQTTDEQDPDRLYSVSVMGSMMDSMIQGSKTNNLADFKAWLDSGESGMEELTTDITYTYSTPLTIYRTDNGLQKVNPSTLFSDLGVIPADTSATLLGQSMQMDVWTQLTGNEDLLKAQYDVVAGRLPEQYNEVVLLVNEDNRITDYTLYTLGLLDAQALQDAVEAAARGEDVSIDTEVHSYSYDDILSLRFRLLTNTDCFVRQDGQWVDKSDDEAYLLNVLNSSDEIAVVGILRPAEGATTGSGQSGVIGYRADLMTHLLDKVNSAEIVREQQADPTVDVFTGLPFEQEELKDAYTMEELQAYAAQLPAEAQQELMGYVSSMQAAGMDDGTIATQLMRAALSQSDGATYTGNLKRLGVSDPDDPEAINLFPKDFEAKDRIADRIAEYNKSLPEDAQLAYTDYIGLMISSITTIINAISYILIAFVAVSLVVSSIMIGIITYISVLERTREIGVLRSIGASRRDISRVFNAETLTIGFAAGAIGIGITLLLILPLNAIIHHLSGLSGVAALPAGAAVILVAISMLLTFLAGLIPSRIAAKKDPVIALRSE